MDVYRQAVRPALFGLDAERAHNLTVRAADVLGRLTPVRRWSRDRYRVPDERLRMQLGELTLDNPIGLAAGFDKNGRATPLLRSLGFGHVEIGSISASPSLGNPRPRLFRLPEDEGVAVWYGVPNEGAEKVALNLRRRRVGGGCPLGINLVRTNSPAAHAADEQAVYDDYVSSFAVLQQHADFITLNLSCPNTNGQEFFDDPARLSVLLDRLGALGVRVPVVLKLRPTTDSRRLKDLVEVAAAHPPVRGLHINLPGQRPADLQLRAPQRVAACPGAIAGRPVAGYIDRVLGLLARTVRECDAPLTLFAAGGVFDADDAYRKIRLGASFVQVYTALIYRGPAMIPEILRGLLDRLDADGVDRLTDVVGADL